MGGEYYFGISEKFCGPDIRYLKIYGSYCRTLQKRFEGEMQLRELMLLVCLGTFTVAAVGVHGMFRLFVNISDCVF